MAENKITLDWFKHLDKMSEFEQLLDFKTLDADGTPKILAKNKTLLVFDNQLYNETYLLDVVNAYLTEQAETREELVAEGIDFLYIDNPYIRKAIFAPSVKPDEYKKNIRVLEKNFLNGAIMVLNPISNHVVAINDRLTIIDNRQIQAMISWLSADKEGATVLGRNERLRG